MWYGYMVRNDDDESPGYMVHVYFKVSHTFLQRH